MLLFDNYFLKFKFYVNKFLHSIHSQWQNISVPTNISNHECTHALFFFTRKDSSATFCNAFKKSSYLRSDISPSISLLYRIISAYGGCVHIKSMLLFIRKVSDSEQKERTAYTKDKAALNVILSNCTNSRRFSQ